jgi:hypothetical protein
MKLHVKECRKRGYKEINYTHDGVEYSATTGPVAIDGAGCKRAYNHHITGTETAAIVQSPAAGVCLHLEHSQVSMCCMLSIYTLDFSNNNCMSSTTHHRLNCINCTRTLNRQIEERGGIVLPEDYSSFNLKHEGTCYRKTTYTSAAAEEFEQEKAGAALLLDNSGNRRGSDTAIFAKIVISDNDTRGPNRLMRKQRDIIGPNAASSVDAQAVCHPDLNHHIKNASNNFHATAVNDKSFKGKYALNSVRIRTISSDITKVIKQYKPYVGDQVHRHKCLDQLAAIIRHHCGDHTRCKNPMFCTYLQCKDEHPLLTPAELDDKYASNSKRNEGKYMNLTSNGIITLENIISKRFNIKNIDSIANCASSNACEGYFGQLTKFTEGKRLQGNGTDFYQTALETTFCNNNGKDVERTKVELSEQLSLTVTPVETAAHAIINRKRKRDYDRLNSDLGRSRRMRKKLFTAHRIDKDANKSKHHKSEKVKVQPAVPKNTKEPCCSNCKIMGHTKRQCIYPPKPVKSTGELINWHDMT